MLGTRRFPCRSDLVIRPDFTCRVAGLAGLAASDALEELLEDLEGLTFRLLRVVLSPSVDFEVGAEEVVLLFSRSSVIISIGGGRMEGLCL